MQVTFTIDKHNIMTKKVNKQSVR